MIMQFEGGQKRCIKHWTVYKKPFALEGCHWAMMSVLSLFIAFWSSFAYARTILYFFLPLFTTKGDTFFLLPHHTKG